MYRQNLNILKQRFPEITDILNDADTEGFLVLPARVSEYTLRSPDGLTLHSLIDPIREAEEFVRAKGMGSGGRWIVFGFGLGYHLQAAMSTPGRIDELVAVELCPEVVRVALEHVDMTDLLAWSGFHLWLPGGIPSLEQRITDLPADFRMAVHPPSLALWRRRDLPLVEILDRMELRRMNEHYSGAAYQEAVDANRQILSTCPDMASYFDTVQHRVVMVAGAGPSLDEAKPLIKKFRSRLFLLAANAAFIPLRNAGIQPDAVVCVEPRAAATASFDGQGEKHLPLIFVPGTNHQVIENWHGPRLLAYGRHDSPSPHTGTVAGTALDVAIRLGGNPIILTGLDLTTSGNWYAKGVVKPPDEQASKALAARQVNHHAFSDTYLVPAVDGGIVPTTRAFRYFIESLECLIDDAKLKHPTLRIFDLKGRGALIDGATPMPPNRESMEIILNPKFAANDIHRPDWKVFINGVHP